MDKETYKKKTEYLSQELLSINNEIQAIRERYIEKNKTFEIGDRVKTKHNDIGIVFGFDLDWNNDVKPLMYKEKKDGTRSKHKLNVYYASDIVGLADIF